MQKNHQGHPTTYGEIYDFCQQFKILTEGCILFTIKYNPGSDKFSSDNYIVDFDDKCLRTEFPETYEKRARTNSDQYSIGQLSTQGDNQPGNQSLPPIISSAAKSFLCKGNDLSSFMPIETF